jgi:hypothetical protein
MFQNQNNSNIRDSISLAGWLFADLFLGLAMLFLIFNTQGTEISYLNLVTSTPTLPPTSSISIAQTPTVDPSYEVGLDLVPHYITIPNSDDNSIKNQISQTLEQFPNKRAGLVITLGYHDEIRKGMALANKVNGSLKELYPIMFSNAVMKPFWYSIDQNHPIGTVVAEIYFFTPSK